MANMTNERGAAFNTAHSFWIMFKELYSWAIINSREPFQMPPVLFQGILDRAARVY
jgi:hypothetical protein